MKAWRVSTTHQSPQGLRDNQIIFLSGQERLPGHFSYETINSYGKEWFVSRLQMAWYHVKGRVAIPIRKLDEMFIVHTEYDKCPTEPPVSSAVSA